MNTDRRKMELIQIIDVLKERGYEAQGVLFYDPKLKLLGIAPLAGIPEAWIEKIGARLGNVAGWTNS